LSGRLAKMLASTLVVKMSVILDAGTSRFTGIGYIPVSSKKNIIP